MTDSEAPRRFSWLFDGLLAGSGRPFEASNFQYYLDNNIRTLVTLTVVNIDVNLVPDGMKHVYMPVKDYTAPSAEQIEQFEQLVEEARSAGHAVCVHCWEGHGRTGTMLAAYLIKTQGRPAEEVIKQICDLRPGSVQSKVQEESLYAYAEWLDKSAKNQNGEVS